MATVRRTQKPPAARRSLLTDGILSNLPLPVLRSNPQGRITFANPAARRLCGPGLTKLHASVLYAGGKPEAANVLDQLRKSRNRQLHDVSITIVRRDHEEQRVIASFALLDSGDVIGVLSVGAGALLSSITEIATALARNVSPAATLHVITYQSMQLVSADRAYIKLPEGESLVIRAIYPESDFKIGLSTPLERGMTGWAYRHLRSYVSGDVTLEDEEHYYPLFPDTHSKIAVPLLANPIVALHPMAPSCLGVLAVDCRRKHAFTQDHVALLEAVAIHASLALINTDEMKAIATAYERLSADLRATFHRMPAPRYLHEAKNVLYSIARELKSIDTELAAGQKPGQVASRVRRLRSPIMDMADVLSEELDRLKVAKDPSHRERVLLAPLIRRACSVARLADRNISIHCDITEPDGTSVYASADAVLIILLNLLSNSTKAIRESECGANIWVRTPKAGAHSKRMVRIVVEDDGPGIKRESLKLIHHQLRQDSLAPGHGFGLIHSKELALAQGGTFDITSEVGHGVRVTVDLQRA